MPQRHIELREGEYYHLYNRGHNREHIFFERENYIFFLFHRQRHTGSFSNPTFPRSGRGSRICCLISKPRLWKFSETSKV